MKMVHSFFGGICGEGMVGVALALVYLDSSVGPQPFFGLRPIVTLEYDVTTAEVSKVSN